MQKGINIHLYPSDITSESRMMKITATLAQLGLFSKIWLIGILSPKTVALQVIDDSREIHRFARPLPAGTQTTHLKSLATLRWSWAVWRGLRGQHVRCINCHSLPVLPLCVALKLRHRAVLVYDTHELETETSTSHGLKRRLFRLTEAALIRFVDVTFCVGEMIADWYKQHYPAIARPIVVRNIPNFKALQADEISPLRSKLGLGPDAVIVLYLGKLSANRGIERLLGLFPKLTQPVHIVFMGEGPLFADISALGQTCPTIHCLPPVPFTEVVAHARGADMGMSVIDHSCLSYTYAMPNKFFEYLQAGVPVLIGDMPEQRAIIEEHKAGWLLPDTDTAAMEFLNSLTRKDIAEKKRNAAAISGLFSWEKESLNLIAEYRSIIRH